MKWRAPRWAGYAVIGAWVAAAPVMAQPAVPPEEPQPLTVHLARPTLSLEVEGDSLRTSRPDDPVVTDDRTIDFTPLLGLAAEGSVYHAKLLEFNLESETGFTRGQHRYDDGAGNVTHDDRDFTIERYNGTATILRDKPYSASIFGNKRRDERDYDQFNRFNVDSETYGAALRGSSPKWFWTLRDAHYDEQVDNTDRPSSYREDLLSYNAQCQHHANGRTTVRYSHQDFERQDDGAAAYDGLQQTLTVFDEESGGSNQQDRLLSSLTASDLNGSLQDNRAVTWREDYQHEHRENLKSGATYQYDRRETSSPPDDNDPNAITDATFQQHLGEVSLEHRLYENLDSRGDLQVERSEGEGDHETRYGPGAAEHYTRGLGDVGRLGADLDGRVDHIHRQVSSSTITVIAEPLRLDDRHPAFLALPNVQASSIVVTDASGARRYLLNFDYRAIARGAFTEIQRVFGGAIPQGALVLVDYVADGGGSETINRGERRLGVDLELYERRLYLYAEQRASDSLGDSSLVYEDYRDNVAGVKSRWVWIEVGVEHVDHTADTLSYDGLNYYGDLFWDGDATAVRLHAGRSNLDYRDQPGGLDTRNYTATLDYRPIGNLTLEGFAGYYREFTLDGTRNLVTLEGRAVYAFSRLSLDGSYRFEDDDRTQEDDERHYFLLRVNRQL